MARGWKRQSWNKAMVQQTQRPERTELAGAHLLLVEDDRLILMDLEAQVRDADAAIVDMCTDIDTALALIDRTERIDAALLDIRLGHDSIAPVARALQARGIPFAFYSGQGETDPVHLEWPAAGVVHKPAPPWAIVSMLARTISDGATARAAAHRHA